MAAGERGSRVAGGAGAGGDGRVLCLVRHGPAVEPGSRGYSEATRPLTVDGRKKVLLAARGLKRLDVGADVVVASPLARARETAGILADVLGLPAPRVDDRLCPDAAPGTLLGVLESCVAENPVLVGHEPSLSAALAALTGAAGDGGFEFKKCGVAVVRLRGGAAHLRGTLLQFLSPGVLRRLGR